MSLLATVATPESRKIAEDCASRGGTMKVVGDGIASYCDLDGFIGFETSIPKRVPQTKPLMLGNVKVSGIIALIVILGLLYWAYKAYPTVTKWIVGIALGIFLAFCAYLYLFFSWGGPTNWEKWTGRKTVFS